MKLAPEKWAEGASPGEQVGDVAVRTLAGRLGAVLHYLSLAAEKPSEDVEHTHQLRVWARRATAALSLYENLLPRRRACWMRKQLRRVRAAGDARDGDVLIARLEKKQAGRREQRWLEAVRRERVEAQEAIVAVYERLARGHRFRRRIDELVRRVRSRDHRSAVGAGPFADWARELLRPVMQRFFRAVPSDRTGQSALHRFRIRSKELRYVLELLAGAFPERVRAELCPGVEAIQDRLGEINDLATATARLRHRVETAGEGAAAAVWKEILKGEQSRLDGACRAFWDWCTPQLLDGLRGGLEAILALPGQAPAARNGHSVAASSTPITPLGRTSPQDARVQPSAVEAVFRCWQSQQVIASRRFQGEAETTCLGRCSSKTNARLACPSP
jgi:CHAD domain-containing protein